MSCFANREFLRAVMLVFFLLPGTTAFFNVAAVAQDTAAFPAADSLKGLPNSLRFVPADASFYYSMLNNRLKWDAVVGSDAVQEFLATPAGQRLKNELLQKAWDDIRNVDTEPLAQWQRDGLEFLTGEQGRAYLPLLVNLASQELFAFADGSLDEQLTEIDEAIGEAFRSLPGPPPGDMVASIPRIVAGARLTNDRDQKQVIELLTLLESAFRHNVFGLSESELEFLSQSLTRNTVSADHDVWTFKLNLSNYPWDAAITRLKNDPNLENPDEAVEAMEYRRDHAQDGTVVITVGVQHGYLVATIASEQYHRPELAVTEPLYKTPIFKPLLAKRNKTFSGVGYQSSVNQQQMSWINTYARMLPIASVFVQGMVDERVADPVIAQKLIDDVNADITELQNDLRATFTPAGDRLNFGYLYDGGIAGYRYHLPPEPLSAQPQTLEVLKHVGPDPLLFHASADWSTDNLLQTWMDRIETRVQQFTAVLKTAEVDRTVDDTENPLVGFLSSIFRTTKEKFLPSLGNQSAWVVDLSIRSKDWHIALPPAEAELPIPAVALVYQMRDAAQHRQAWQQYYETVAPLIVAMGPLVGLPPGSELPQATESDIEGGTYLHVPGASALGAESRFSPGLALSDQWAVYGLFPSQATTLLDRSSPQLPPPLTDIERPLIAASYLNFQQLAEAIELWVEYSQPLIEPALRQQQRSAADFGDAADGAQNDISPAETLALGKMLLRGLQTMDSYSQATFTEDNAVVTQYVLRIPTLKVPASATAR